MAVPMAGCLETTCVSSNSWNMPQLTLLASTMQKSTDCVSHKYANLGHGKTIHSKGQMENFGIVVDDRARSAGGNQFVITTEGYVIPLHIRDGLP
eukprot:scaffold20852_cov99-Amphora_coffeaeformis.AAC.1